MSDSNEINGDDFGSLTLGDEMNEKKARRFSVHDVAPDDNQISYGQPDNEAISNKGFRILSVDDDIDDAQKERRHSDSQNRDSGDDTNDVQPFIHENVDDNNYEEYAVEETSYDHNGDNELDGDNDDTPNDDAARESQEEENDAFPPPHYRHPSLLDNESMHYLSLPHRKYAKSKYAVYIDPIDDDDDDDMDREHGRNFSTIIHEDVDSLV